MNTSENDKIINSKIIIESNQAQNIKDEPHKDIETDKFLGYEFDVKQTKKQITFDIFFLVMIALIRAVSTQVFIVPNKFAPGGVTGIASIIYNIVAIYNPSLADSVFNPAIVMFILHIPLVVVAFFKINKKFALRSALTLVMISVFAYVIKIVNIPQFIGMNTNSLNDTLNTADTAAAVLNFDTRILGAIAAGALSGFSIGFLLRLNCSTGGTDLLGRLLQLKKPHNNVVWLIFACDIFVVMLSSVVGILDITNGAYAGTVLSPDSILILVLTPMLYSGITLFISSMTADFIFKKHNSAVVFQIITCKTNTVCDAIKQILKKTATVLTGKGAYSKTNRDVVVFVVKKSYVIEVKKLIQNVDPKSFTIITNANEVYGVGFKGY